MPTIIVPTVFRPDYIGALRRLSRDGDPDVLIAAMSRLWVKEEPMNDNTINDAVTMGVAAKLLAGRYRVVRQSCPMGCRVRL